MGRLRLRKLTAQHVESLLTEKEKQGLSARYVAYIRSVLRIALNQAKKRNLVGFNVVDLVDAPRVERYRAKTLDQVETRRLFEAVKGERLETLYSVAVSVGLRRGEILGLQWQDIDFENCTLSVERTVQRIRGEGIKAGPPKTERGRRTITLPAPLIASLKLHRKSQLEERLKMGTSWQDSDLVFSSNVGTFLEPRNLDRHFKRMLAKAGLPNMRLHDLRHSAATLLLAQNVNPRVVMEILGHSRISMTLDTYGHVMYASIREATDKVSAILWERKDPEDKGLESALPREVGSTTHVSTTGESQAIPAGGCPDGCQPMPEETRLQEKPFDFIGGADADRTRDLLNAIQALSQTELQPHRGEIFQLIG